MKHTRVTIRVLAVDPSDPSQFEITGRLTHVAHNTDSAWIAGALFNIEALVNDQFQDKYRLHIFMEEDR